MSEEQPEYELVTAPSEGLPPVVNTVAALAECAERLASASGPLAIDTERAQSFRYSGKAYLIQVRREGGGTHLIDPVAFETDADRADFSSLASTLADAEWIVHAATQDLPCLAEVGLLPRRLFDTELAGRLLGLPRVSLGSLTEVALGKSLLKEHSASDWSRRPLPDDWLTYAALDVELLVPLRQWVVERLAEAGKSEWAEQEFAWLAHHADDPPRRRDEPWRRTSGVHDVRTPRGLAVVRELWTTRDELACRQDRAPGRLLGDRAISELAVATEAEGTVRASRDLIRRVKGFSWRAAARYETNWVAAVERAASLTRAQLPSLKATLEGPPPPRTWANRNPEAFERWNRLRPATIALAEELHLPTENLIAPDAVRRLAWSPPEDVSTAGIDAFLNELDARPWQRELVVPVVAAQL